MFTSTSSYQQGHKSPLAIQAPTSHVPLLDAVSIANSQSSSFDESIASQSSQQPPLSPETIRFSQVNPQSESTPSTSISTLSSQDPTVEDGQNVRESPAGATSYSTRGTGLLVLEGSCSQQPTLPSRAEPNERKIPNKRLANGEVKHAEQTLPGTQVAPERHSRNISTSSRGSHIGELSSQLRTRLSYAMIKVQNGWQGHSFEELESLSQQGSPISTVSDTRRSIESPRSTLIDTQNDSIKFAQPYERMIAAPENLLPMSHVHNEASSIDYPSFSSGHPTSIAKTTSTYESFWREHSTGISLRDAHKPSPPYAGPSLAPPVDIVPRNHRNSGSPKAKPPLLDTRSHNIYNHGGGTSFDSSLMGGQATPPKRLSALRTPSQKAAMEQDAVETLLFMSSPGNSGHQPQARSAVTSLRAIFTSQEKRVGFADASRGVHESEDDRRPGEAFRSPRDFPRAECIVNGADIDRLLDEMPDDASSSEDDDHVGQHQF